MQIRLRITKTDPEMRSAASEPKQQTGSRRSPPRFRRHLQFHGRENSQKSRCPYADPQRYGRHIGQELDKAMGATLSRLEALQMGFAADRQETRRKLDDLV